MVERLNRRFVCQCAPTLAGLKVGSLFCCERGDARWLCPALSSWKKALQNKGIAARILCMRNERALIYVYRQRQLEQILSEPEVQAFLREFGYRSFSVEGAIADLIARIGGCSSFPHEIGVFLGYPLGDIRGLIENRGKNYKLCGCWKVYGDERSAQAQFQAFQDCRAHFCALFNQGCSISSLVEAA